MQKLTYRITTQSPVLITENAGDTNMVASADYISGSAVYGCLANRYIQKHFLGNTAHKDETFYRWFLRGGLCFSNGYIVSKNKHGEIIPNYPMPLSIQKEKKDETEIHDLFFAVDNFDEPTSSISGFGRLQGNSFYQQSVKKSLNFHHQRDSEKGVVKEGMIFNYESIGAGQTFEGNIYGSEEDLNKFISIFGNEDAIHLGRSRNAQYSMARFEIVSEKPEEIQNAALHNGEVSLTLLSNAVIYNENGFSTTDISMLQKALGDGIAIKKAFIKTGDAEGFVSIWRLRRPSERCFLAGSCFLLEVDEGARSRLEEFQREGIGERRAEGFGRVAFGIPHQGELTLREEDDRKLQKPSWQMPSLAKDIAITVAKDFIKRQVELEGLKSAEDFSKRKELLPSKSLVSRLEAMVKNSGEMQIDKLRKTAKDQLEKCHNKNNTLYEFLTNTQPQGLLNEVMKKNRQQDITKLCDETGFSPEADQNFQKEIYRIYFIVFFSAMRKIIKKKGGEQ
jgi:CRISPR-associated protein Csx10